MKQPTLSQFNEKLVDEYCFDNKSEAGKNLKQLLHDRSRNEKYSIENMTRELKNVETIAIKRVNHILNNKLRGGYETSCLLLTACAEAKQIIDQSGNMLIKEIDTEFKRFSAFRKELKALTKKSEILITVK